MAIHHSKFVLFSIFDSDSRSNHSCILLYILIVSAANTRTMNATLKASVNQTTQPTNAGTIYSTLNETIVPSVEKSTWPTFKPTLESTGEKKQKLLLCFKMVWAWKLNMWRKCQDNNK